MKFLCVNILAIVKTKKRLFILKFGEFVILYIENNLRYWHDNKRRFLHNYVSQLLSFMILCPNRFGNTFEGLHIRCTARQMRW